MCDASRMVPYYQEVGAQGRASSFVMQMHTNLAVHTWCSAKTHRSPEVSLDYSLRQEAG